MFGEMGSMRGGLGLARGAIRDAAAWDHSTRVRSGDDGEQKR
jgi:hypothetical protein